MFRDITLTFVMRSAIWYHLHNSKNVKNAHGGVSLLFKSNTPQWAFFAFFKLYKWYQIMQCKSSHMYFQIMLCVQWFVHVVLVTCCLSIVDVKVKLNKATIAVDFRGWWCHSDGDTARISQRKPQRDPNAF